MIRYVCSWHSSWEDIDWTYSPWNWWDSMRFWPTIDHMPLQRIRPKRLGTRATPLDTPCTCKQDFISSSPTSASCHCCSDFDQVCAGATWQCFTSGPALASCPGASLNAWFAEAQIENQNIIFEYKVCPASGTWFMYGQVVKAVQALENGPKFSIPSCSYTRKWILMDFKMYLGFSLYLSIQEKRKKKHGL